MQVVLLKHDTSGVECCGLKCANTSSPVIFVQSRILGKLTFLVGGVDWYCGIGSHVLISFGQECVFSCQMMCVRVRVKNTVRRKNIALASIYGSVPAPKKLLSCVVTWMCIDLLILSG